MLGGGFKISDHFREPRHEAKAACNPPSAGYRRILSPLNNLLIDTKSRFIGRGDGVLKALSGGKDNESRKQGVSDRNANY